MLYEIYNDNCFEWNLCCPLPLWKCKNTSFKLRFSDNALLEGETLEMANTLKLAKVYGDLESECFIPFLYAI
jgi:hypothetical protein